MKDHSESEGAQAPVTVELECLECHTGARVDLSAEQFRSMSTSWRIAQQCGHCGKPTDWTFGEAAVGAEEQVDFWDWLASTGERFESQRWERQDERRKERRLDLHVPLRVAADGEEEQVISENISKSGFCFLSTKPHKPGDQVRVTLELPGGPQNINATIVRSAAAGEGKTLCGARIGD